MDEPQDPGDVMHVPEEDRLDSDPNPREEPTHAALGDGGPDNVSDVDEGEVVNVDQFDDADEQPSGDDQSDHQSGEGVDDDG